MISDIDEVGKIFAEEKIFCEQCGDPLPLWPPEMAKQHLHDKHAAMFWPPAAKEWADYLADPDLERRQNYITAYRVRWLLIVLQNRADLYKKLHDAGVVKAPAQG